MEHTVTSLDFCLSIPEAIVVYTLNQYKLECSELFPSVCIWKRNTRLFKRQLQTRKSTNIKSNFIKSQTVTWTLLFCNQAEPHDYIYLFTLCDLHNAICAMLYAQVSLVFCCMLLLTLSTHILVKEKSEADPGYLECFNISCLNWYNKCFYNFLLVMCMKYEKTLLIRNIENDYQVTHCTPTGIYY